MTLEIYNNNFEKIQTADYEMGTWDWDRIVNMSKAGYSFKLDGKWIKIGDSTATAETCESQPDSKRFKDIKSVDELKQICSNALDKFEQENPELAEKAYTAIANKFPSSDNVPEYEGVSENTSNPPMKQMIECIETGKLYAKQSHAARDLGIDPSYVSDSIKTGKQHKGYSFRKVLKPV